MGKAGGVQQLDSSIHMTAQLQKYKNKKTRTRKQLALALICLFVRHRVCDEMKGFIV